MINRHFNQLGASSLRLKLDLEEEIEAPDNFLRFCEDEDNALIHPCDTALIDAFPTLDGTRQQTVLDLVQLLLKQAPLKEQ